MSSGSLVGERIVVTGAGRGIGRAIALACGREGAQLGLGYRTSAEGVREVAEAIVSGGGIEPATLPFDVRDAEASALALGQFSERYGGVDVLVNNAGVSAPGLLLRLDLAIIREALETNLLGPIVCTQAVLQGMLRRRHGVVITIGSVAATRPYAGQTAYAASKGGVEAFTRALAVEYARKGIRAHCVVPGPTQTQMLDATCALSEDAVLSRIPMRRLGTPEDVAALVVFLASPAASYMTAGVHFVDGGYVQG